MLLKLKSTLANCCDLPARETTIKRKSFADELTKKDAGDEEEIFV
jgi:hypothetical protein